MADERLENLQARWRALARRKFQGATQEKNSMGKKLIEHGAMCYLNCALELNEALGQASPSPPAPGTPSRDQR